MNFNTFIRKVNAQVIEMIGLTTDDLEDYDFQDDFNEKLSVTESAQNAVEYSLNIRIDFG